MTLDGWVLILVVGWVVLLAALVLTFALLGRPSRDVRLAEDLADEAEQEPAR